MPRPLLVVALTLCPLVVACGGGGGGGQPDAMAIVPDDFTAAAPGTPMGTPVEQTVGPAGGEVATGDGRLTVVIPAGALAADTRVAVQPITATAPNAVGVAYRLTPEGTTFAQPVTLRFQLAPADLAGSAAELLQVATQDAAGFWRLATGQAVDAAAGTVALTTRHFSDWTLLQDVRVQPSSASVRAGASLPLALIACFREEVVSGSDGPRYLCREGEARRFAVRRWLVNGVAGGNATVGTVLGGGPATTYQAPARAPRPGDVQVAAELDGPGGARALVFASLDVYDDDFVVEGRWQAVTTYTHARADASGDHTYLETVTVDATLVGYMGVTMVSESGTMTVAIRQFDRDPILGVSCTFTTTGAGPIRPFSMTMPSGAMVFLEVPGDSEHMYYATGVPFGADVPATMTAECTGQPTETFMTDSGAFWLVVPGPYDHKTPRSLDSLSGVYEKNLGGEMERWSWQITRVGGSN
jgi:hypothetical protein